MELEVEALKEQMDVKNIVEKASMKFYEGTLRGKDVVIVQCGIGKVNAGICVQILADLFQVDAVINTGVAGSLRAEINIGDIVISTDAVHHDMDVSALFGNMLDNAIESAEKQQEKQKRLIWLYVTREKQFVRIRTENYCDEKIHFKNGMPVTTKKDRRLHGYGMKSIKSTVEKYNGSVVAAQENNWFELKILLPAGR